MFIILFSTSHQFNLHINYFIYIFFLFTIYLTFICYNYAVMQNLKITKQGHESLTVGRVSVCAAAPSTPALGAREGKVQRRRAAAVCSGTPTTAQFFFKSLSH